MITSFFSAIRDIPGDTFDHGMGNNEYVSRPWHLPEETHATNWATSQMARIVKRRDPNRPAFWFISYRHPHPPIVPLQIYLDLYRDIPIDEPYCGSWAAASEDLSLSLQANIARGREVHIATDYRCPSRLLCPLHPY